MRLDPVYLLPPEPDRRVKLSRRAFLVVMAGTFGVGALSGAAGGWLAFARERSEPTELNAELPERLQWARERAVGPIEALCDEAVAFVSACALWPDDPQLVEGLDRLVREVCERRDLASRRTIALVVLRHIDRFPSRLASTIERIPLLRSLAGR